MKPKLVLIGGGTGFVGGGVCGALKWHGFKPRIITRLPSEEGLKTKTQVSWSDLKRRGLPEDCYGIINLCGANIGNPWARWTESYKRQVWESRISTTETLRDLIVNAKKKPAVFVSSSAVGYYPPSETMEYTEESGVREDSGDFFQSLCKDWEAAARLPQTIPVRQVTVRIGLVLGRSGGLVAQSFWPFFLGMGGPLGSGSQWFPWVHVDDLAAIFVHAVESEGVRGVLNGVAPQHVTNKEFAKAFASALHRPCIFPMPELAVKSMFGDERAKLMLSGQKVWPKRTLESGYEFLYDDIWEAAMEFSRVTLNEDEMKRPRSRLGNTHFTDLNFGEESDKK